MLFDDDPSFTGFPSDRFDVFSMAHREERRRAIIAGFHPQLEVLGKLAVRRLAAIGSKELHAHLPKLNWPPGYQPFCTWLALSVETHGYQDGPQLNLGVHADHVAARLGWDTRSDRFGRFEFLCRHGELGQVLTECAAANDMKIRVYAAARWPRGSRLTFETGTDVAGSFNEVNRRGVWWEIGRRYELPERAEFVDSEDLGRDVLEVFETLFPVYQRAIGSH
jgi:uncharacterized protein YktB (UPF0637 family)